MKATFGFMTILTAALVEFAFAFLAIPEFSTIFVVSATFVLLVQVLSVYKMRQFIANISYLRGMSKHIDFKSRVVINKMQTSMMTIYSRVIQSYVVKFQSYGFPTFPARFRMFWKMMCGKMQKILDFD